ncbi:hypothetical protein JCM8202_003008 [Rhodotorula sphaerocarpa]
MTGITLRVRGPTGQSTVSLSSDATLKDLKSKVREATGIVPDRQEFRAGFPPKPFAQDADSDVTLSTLGASSGTTLIVSETSGPAATATLATGSDALSSAAQPVQSKRPSSPPSSSVSKQPKTTGGTRSSGMRPAARATTSGKPKFVETDGGFLVLRAVPDDNSCLFRAVGLALASQERDASASLRKIVADTIRADSDTYSEAVLGRPPADYISTILKSNSWGGAIELSVFAANFRTEIRSIDVQTGRVDRFGEDAGYETFVLLVYSGIHYDVLTLSFVPPEGADTFPPPNIDFDTRVFPKSEEHLMDAAEKLVGQLRTEHAYTDTATFSLQCGVCREALTGEKEARRHAETTGHTAFEEYQG